METHLFYRIFPGLNYNSMNSDWKEKRIYSINVHNGIPDGKFLYTEFLKHFDVMLLKDPEGLFISEDNFKIIREHNNKRLEGIFPLCPSDNDFGRYDEEISEILAEYLGNFNHYHTNTLTLFGLGNKKPYFNVYFKLNFGEKFYYKINIKEFPENREFVKFLKLLNKGIESLLLPTMGEIYNYKQDGFIEVNL